MPAPLIPAAIATAGKFLPSLGAIGKLLFSKKVLAAPLALEGLQILGGTKSLGQSGKDFLIDVGLSATGLAGLQKAKALGKLPKMLQGDAAENLLTGGLSLVGVPLVSSAVDSVLGIGNQPRQTQGNVYQTPGTLNPADLLGTTVPESTNYYALQPPGGTDPSASILQGLEYNNLAGKMMQDAMQLGAMRDFSQTLQNTNMKFI
jgi:hypothetical protein